MRVNLSRRERMILAVTVVLLVAVVAYFGVYEKLGDQWTQLNDEIQGLDYKLQASIKNYQEEAKIKKEYDEVVASLRIEGNESDKQVKIMQEINGLMQEAGVPLSTAKPLNIIEDQNFQIFSFAYDEIETNMVNLAKFLGLLEKRSKVSEIQMIQIKPPSPALYGPGEQRFKVSFRISRLVYKR